MFHAGRRVLRNYCWIRPGGLTGITGSRRRSAFLGPPRRNHPARLPVETKGGGLKIVYLSPAAGLGGAERCLLDMMAAVRKADSRVDIHLLTSVDGPLIERARQLDVTSVCCQCRPLLSRWETALSKGPASIKLFGS